MNRTEWIITGSIPILASVLHMQKNSTPLPLAIPAKTGVTWRNQKSHTPIRNQKKSTSRSQMALGLSVQDG